MKKLFRRCAMLVVIASTMRCIAAPRELSIADAGAVADGTTLNTEMIQAAIDQLAAKGGGTVVVPKGAFSTGALFLKPGVNLHLETEAVLKGTADAKDYPQRRIRIEGHIEGSYSSGLINAEKCDGLQITGEGTLDGNGRPIWDEFWKQRNAAADKKNFRNLSIPRAQLCIINHSKNVLIDGVTFKDSQYWNLHLYDCRNVTVQNARFQVPDDYKQAPSTDGIDVDSCQDVEIKGCTFSVTDDCIAMKGTWGPFALDDKESRPVERVRVTDCTFRRGHAAITCGSDATIVRNLVVESCQVIGAITVLCLKLRSDTPQTDEDVHLRGLTLTEVKGRYGKFGVIQPNPGQTKISDITIKNLEVQLKDGKLKAGSEVKNLKIENVTVNGKQFSL